MIGRLLDVLSAAGEDTDARDVADALWLAAHLSPGRNPASTTGPPAPEGASGSARPAPFPQGPAEPPPEPEPAAGPPAPGAGRLTVAPARTGAPRAATPVRLPAVPALPQAHAITRALRPLRRRVPSRRWAVLDEEATVDRVTDTGLWLPVLRPAPARWLDLALVVDDGTSMELWRQEISELRLLTERVGAFRTVDHWRLSGGGRAGGPVALRRGRAGSGGADRHPAELVDPTRRRVVLVVSDCIGERWADGTMSRLLEEWGRSGPVAVIQPLPHRLWRRCPPALHRVLLDSAGAGAPNLELRVRDASYTDRPLPGGIPVPVLELDAPWLERWSSLVAGRSRELMIPVMLTGSPTGSPPPPASLPGPRQALQRFRATSSPTAYRLATHLATAPLTLPVMRLVQRLTLPQSPRSDLAEVFLGGLLTRVGGGPGAPEDEVLYDFRDGIRTELLSVLGRGEALAILRHVSAFFQARSGSALDFRALLLGEDDAVAAAASDRVFAEVAAQVLLGAGYGTVAGRLVRPAPDSAGGLPPPAARSAATRPDAVGLRAGPSAVGRARLLEELEERLAAAAPRPQVLAGPEGCGTTTVAGEFVRRHGPEHLFVAWVSATSPESVRAGTAAAARTARQLAAGPPDGAAAGPPRPWLLVLDGARPGDWPLPETPPGPGAILVTSPSADWPASVDVHPVGGLDRAAGLRLLRELLPEEDPAGADRLAERLDDLPLALTLAAARIRATGEGIAGVLELLGERGPEGPAAEAFALCAAELTPRDRELAGICAVLGPEPVPLRWLTGTVRPDPERFAASRALLRLGLLGDVGTGTGDGRVRTHPLVQRLIRDRMTAAELDVARSRAGALLAEAGPGAGGDALAAETHAALLPHLRPAGVLAARDPRQRRLMLDQLRSLRARGDLATARVLAEETLRRPVWHEDPGDADTRVAVRLLAGVLLAQGEQAQAELLASDLRGWLARHPGPAPAQEPGRPAGPEASGPEASGPGTSGPGTSATEGPAPR
jgi:hypothetical protein